MSTLYRKIQRKRLKNGLHRPVTLGVSLREVWTENGEYRDADTMSHYTSVKSSWAQRNTFIETKNRTLQCLKWHYSLCDQWKTLQCWRRMGHLPSFFVPTPGELTAQESPPPGICHLQQKNANARGSFEEKRKMERKDWLLWQL